MIARHPARPLVFVAAALTLGAPAVALGQEVGPYDPLGIRAGGFLIYPTLSVSEAYDDNVFAVPNNEDDDLITLIQPGVRVQSNFSRHQLGLTAGSEVAVYVNEENEDYQDFFVSSDGRLDITRQNYLEGALSFARDHVDRDDPEDEANRDLQELYRYGGELSFTQLFNRLNFRVTGRAGRDAYLESEEADRDQVSYDALLRTGFFVSPRVNTFVEGRYNLTHRDRSTDFNGIDRDSDGWGIGAGAEVDLTNLLTGEFQIGYRRQAFDQDGFDDEDGVGYGINLTYTPTRLTTVNLTGAGDFRPTQQEEAESNFRSSLGLDVTHELLRNVRLGAGVGYTRDDFQGENRTDDTISAGARASYLINRNFSIDAGYTFTKRWSDLGEEEFDRNFVRLGVTARL